jgi:CubicO group peptidase (beta-lactamase class C family)
MRILIAFAFCLLSLESFGQVNHKTISSFEAMTQAIEKNHYPNIHSIIIAHGNQTIYEHYFNGFSQGSLHDTRSSFKSITSLLLGIAIDKGYIKNVNQKVYMFFPEYASSFNNDPRKKAMTIKNLLQMESGLDCEEFFDGGKDN